MPTITHDTLTAKLAELDKEHERCVATLNAIAGARQLIAALQADLDAPPTDGTASTQTAPAR